MKQNRTPAKIHTRCRFCYNDDTQQLRAKGGYLHGFAGNVGQHGEATTANELDDFYQGEPWVAHSCFCCVAFWHQNKLERHWFWTRWNKLKFFLNKLRKKIVSYFT